MRRRGVISAGWLVLATALAACVSPPTAPPPSAPLLFADSADLPLPHTLDDALSTLERVLSAEMQVKMRAGREQDMLDYHFTIGLWLRNHWLHGGLEERPLRRWFRTTYGELQADDMSGIVLTSFWRRLNDRPIDVKGQVLELRRWYAAHPPPPAPVIPGPSPNGRDEPRRSPL